MRPPPHPEEEARLAALRSYEILDTPPEEAFEDVTRLAAQLLDVPIALVSLIDEDRQWFKSRVGLGVEQTPRDVAFCAHAIHEPELLVVPDALEDGRFRDNPLVKGDPKIRFYAGAVLRSPGGHPLGTLCVIDRRPRTPSPAALEALGVLSRRVMSEMELRRSVLENRRTNAALSNAEASLRLLLEQVPVGIFRTDATGGCEYANAHAASLTGFRAEDLHGRGWIRAVHPDDRRSISDSWSRAFRLRTELHFECRFLTPEGYVRRLTCQARPLPPGDDGAPRGFLGSLWDVTERHRAELRLRESEARYRLLAEHASELISRLTPEGRVLYASPACRALLDYDPAELQGRTLDDLGIVHPEDRARVTSALRALGDGDGETRLVTFRLLRRDGEPATFETSMRVVRDDARLPVEIVSVSRDVTRQRDLEEQLRQAQKMEAIGQFAGGVAHDFNNVLTVILGHADVLEASLPGGSPEAGDAMAIRESAERAARLTRQLLAYTRRQVLEPSLLDLNRVVGDMEGMLRSLLSDATQLVCEPGADLGPVHVDRGQLEQVILNLAVNARDALGHGGRLTLRTERVSIREDQPETSHVPPGEWALLSVSDDGCGMDEATRRRAFEPFFTTKPREHGTGLGLATVYGIVKQSRGFVYVDSEPGEGTRFRIYLPLARGTAESDGARRGRGAEGGTETVLVVEDQEAIRPMVERYLGRCGYRVLSAASAEQAEEMVRDGRAAIDLLVTDVVLTGASGPELARRLRASQPGMRVLYMSGYAGGDLDEPEELTRSGFLQKPFRLEELSAHVRSALASPVQRS